MSSFSMDTATTVTATPPPGLSSLCSSTHAVLQPSLPRPRPHQHNTAPRSGGNQDLLC